MTRVLHLLTGRGGEASPLLAALLAEVMRHEPGEHHALLLGGEPLRDATVSAGLAPATLLPEPTGLKRLAMPWDSRLQHLLRACDRVDAWTPRAAETARAAGAPAVQPRYHPAALARLAEDYADPARLDGCERDDTRRRWGVNEADTVVALLGDTPSAGDMPDIALAALMAQDTLANHPDATPDARLVLVCHPAATRLHESHHMLTLAGRHGALIQDGRLAQPWEVLPACDAVLPAPDAEHAPLACCWARQAGRAVLEPPTDRPADLANAIAQCFLPQPA